MNNGTWRATMIPLASIIGSGFLIAAPLLNQISGTSAPYLMLFLCVVTFCIGEVIRWNIEEIEPLHDDNSINGKLQLVEKLGDWALAFAYILSITYYLYLFSSFFLKATNLHQLYLEKGITTFIFISIAFYGHQNGLNSLEKVEGISVNLKLSIIFTFLTALAVYNFNHPTIFSDLPTQHHLNLSFDKMSVIFGLLIMVQGFETSRYLSEEYDAKTRVKSMRYSQILSSAIYLLFIVLFIPVFAAHPLPGEVNETSVIDIGKFVFVLAPIFLFVAALASQLSAAVADLGGSGGLFHEVTNKKIKPGNAYLLVAASGIALVWAFDIFKIISFASKAFALYYFLQCTSSCLHNYKKSSLRFAFSAFFAVVCLIILIFGKPFE